MRFVIHGAGAIGGVAGGRLAEAGHDVVLIARGRHGERLASDGLVVRAPSRTVTLRLPVAAHPDDVTFDESDAVLLAVKSQDTPGALGDLARSAPANLAVVCLQNGSGADPHGALRVYGEQVLPALRG